MLRILSARLALAVPVALSPALARSGTGAETQGSCGVTIVAPIAVSEIQPLHFGTITSGEAGSVTIDSRSGARRVAGGAGATAAAVGPPGAFAVTGEPNAAIDIVVGAQITGFSAGITGATSVDGLPSALTGDGARFNVGGTLSIPAKTPSGDYQGVYTVSVNYP